MVKLKSIKTSRKIAAYLHICFLYLARTKVEWDGRTMDFPRKKTGTSDLKHIIARKQ